MDEATEPLRRCVNQIEPARDAEELWLFGPAVSDGVTHRMEMLAKDMSSLSDSLGGLRALLGDVASTAPLASMVQPLPQSTAYMHDDMLFDGEVKTVEPNRVLAAHDADMFLFEGILPLEPMPVTMHELRPQLEMPRPPEDRQAA